VQNSYWLLLVTWGKNLETVQKDEEALPSKHFVYQAALVEVSSKFSLLFLYVATKVERAPVLGKYLSAFS
jgi:hypothetical protein